MAAIHTAEQPDTVPERSARLRISPKRMRQIAWVVVFILFALFGLPFLLERGWVPLPSHSATSYWIGIFTYTVIYSLVTLGLGLLIGRVGLVSLCQFMLLLVGSWAAVRFDQLWPWLPYPAVLLVAGLVTGAIGTLIGLPALRLSGLYLALITLMAAAAITVLLKVQQFPNGGGGFWGVKQGSPISQISRPSIALGDTAFYRYCVCVAIVMLKANNRRWMRPGHTHIWVRAEGYKDLITHVFDVESECLREDPVFGVRDSLVRSFEPDDGELATTFDVILERA